MNIVKELEKHVRKSGSQKASAASLGISTQYLNDLLRGRREASDNVLSKMGLRRVVVRAK